MCLLLQEMYDVLHVMCMFYSFVSVLRNLVVVSEIVYKQFEKAVIFFFCYFLLLFSRFTHCGHNMERSL